MLEGQGERLDWRKVRNEVARKSADGPDRVSCLVLGSDERPGTGRSALWARSALPNAAWRATHHDGCILRRGRTAHQFAGAEVGSRLLPHRGEHLDSP